LPCAFLLRTIFASSARAHKRARVQNIRDFPQTKLNENNICNNSEKIKQKSMAPFLANEINATDRDVTGPKEQVQIMFPSKDKNIN